MFKFLLSAILFLLSAAPALSAEDPRHLWVYNGGYVLDLKNEQKEWVETIDGVVRFRFKETGRDGEAVYLFDASRQLYVYLTGTKLNGGMRRDRPFATLRTGQWDNRRVLFAKSGNVSVTFVLRSGNQWLVTWMQGRSFSNLAFREIRRDIGVVEIKNDELNRRFLILNNGVVYENNGGSSPTIPITTEGRWADATPFG